MEKCVYTYFKTHRKKFGVIAIVLIAALVCNEIGWALPQTEPAKTDALQVQTPFKPFLESADWVYLTRLDQELNLALGLIKSKQDLPYPDINAALDACYMKAQKFPAGRLLDMTTDPLFEGDLATISFRIISGEGKGNDFRIRWNRKTGVYLDFFRIPSPHHAAPQKNGPSQGERSLQKNDLTGPELDLEVDVREIAPADRSKNSQTMFFVLCLTTFYFAVEFVGSIFTGSLSLRADSFHMFMDVASLVLAWGAMACTTRYKLPRKYEGNSLFEIGAAFMNGASILGTSVYIIYEAVMKLSLGIQVEGGLLMAVAIGGLVVNVISALLLLSSSKESINMKGAFLHVIGDAAVSVIVIVSGFLIAMGLPSWIDPLASMGISAWLFYYGFGVTKDSFLMYRGGLKPTSYAIHYLKREWKTLCEELHIDSEHTTEIFNDLKKQYAHGSRHFHNLSHIVFMLKELENVEHLAENLTALKLAIWFHDYVYDPGRDDNREKSAEKAAEICKNFGLSPELIEKVCHLIVSTKDNTADTNDIDAVILCDLNIAILGGSHDIHIETFFDSEFFANIANMSAFAKSEIKILKEAAGGDAELFSKRRLAKLHSLLKTGNIYHLDYFRSRYEEKAVAYIRGVIAQYEKENTVTKNLIYPGRADSENASVFSFLGKENIVYPVFLEELNPLAMEEMKIVLHKAHALKDSLIIVVMSKADDPRTKAILRSNVSVLAKQFADISGVSVIGLEHRNVLLDFLIMIRAAILAKPISDFAAGSILDVNFTDTAAKEHYWKYGIDTVYIKSDSAIQAFAMNKKSLRALSLKDSEAFFRGSFDPVTNIDLELVRRASEVFKTVKVTVATPPSDTMFGLDERIAMFRTAAQMMGLANVEVVDAKSVPAERLAKGVKIAHLYEMRKVTTSGVGDKADIYFPLFGDLQDSSKNVRMQYRMGSDISGLVPANVYWHMMSKRLDHANVKMIGLVGGAGAGKTMILQALHKKPELKCISLDKISDDIYNVPEVKDMLTGLFGTAILDRSGSIDKTALRKEAFKTQNAKELFREITYPVIVKQAFLEITGAIKEGARSVIIDGMRVIDFNMAGSFDELWFVESSEANRVERLCKQKTGMTETEAELIVKSQRERVEQARKMANVVINNDEGYEALADQLESCIMRLYPADIFPGYYARMGAVKRTLVDPFIEQHGLRGRSPDEIVQLISRWYMKRYEPDGRDRVVRNLLQVTYELVGSQDAQVIRKQLAGIAEKDLAAAQKLTDMLSACGPIALLVFFALTEAGARNLAVVEFKRAEVTHISVAIRENYDTVRSLEVDEKYAERFKEILPVASMDAIKNFGCSVYEEDDILRLLIGFILCNAGVALYEAQQNVQDANGKAELAELSRKYLRTATAVAPSFSASDINLNHTGGKITAEDFLYGKKPKWQTSGLKDFSPDAPWKFIVKTGNTAGLIGSEGHYYAHDGSAIDNTHLATYDTDRAGVVLAVDDDHVEFALPISTAETGLPNKDRNKLIALKRMYGLLSCNTIDELLSRSEKDKCNQITIRNNGGIRVEGGFVIVGRGDSYDDKRALFNRYNRAQDFKALAQQGLPLAIIPDGEHDANDLRRYSAMIRRYLTEEGISHEYVNESIVLLKPDRAPDGLDAPSAGALARTEAEIAGIDTHTLALWKRLSNRLEHIGAPISAVGADFVIDLALIDRRDIDENLETIASLIMLLRNEKQIRFVFKNILALSAEQELPSYLLNEYEHTPRGADVMARVRALVSRRYASRLSAKERDELLARIGDEASFGSRTAPVEIDITSLQSLLWMRDNGVALRENQYPVAMDGLTGAGSDTVLLRDFVSAFLVGYSKYALVAAKRSLNTKNGADTMKYEAVKKEVTAALNALYKRVRSGVSLSTDTLEHMIDEHSIHRLNRAIELYLPPIARMLVAELKALHEAEQLLLQFA